MIVNDWVTQLLKIYYCKIVHGTEAYVGAMFECAMYFFYIAHTVYTYLMPHNNQVNYMIHNGIQYLMQSNFYYYYYYYLFIYLYLCTPKCPFLFYYYFQHFLNEV